MIVRVTQWQSAQCNMTRHSAITLIVLSGGGLCNARPHSLCQSLLGRRKSAERGGRGRLTGGDRSTCSRFIRVSGLNQAVYRTRTVCLPSASKRFDYDGTAPPPPPPIVMMVADKRMATAAGKAAVQDIFWVDTDLPPLRSSSSSSLATTQRIYPTDNDWRGEGPLAL